MIHQVDFEEAKTHLRDLIEAAIKGEQVFIKKDDLFGVQLVPQKLPRFERQFGSAKGLIEMADDFDAPLDDFREYTG